LRARMKTVNTTAQQTNRKQLPSTMKIDRATIIAALGGIAVNTYASVQTDRDLEEIDEYTLTRTGDPVAETSTSVSIMYQVHETQPANVYIKFYNFDCTVLLDSGSGLSYTWAWDNDNLVNPLDMTATIDIDFNLVADNELVWNEVGDFEAQLKFCARASLVSIYDFDSDITTNYGPGLGDAVMHVDSSFDVTVSTAQSFGEFSIEAAKVDNELESEGNTNFEELTFEAEYGMTACQCDNLIDRNCVSEQISQNEKLNLCFSIPASDNDVVFDRMKTLTLSQENVLTLNAVADSQANSLTTFEGFGTKEVGVSVALTSAFFNTIAKDVSVEGTVVFRIESSSGRQLVHIGVGKFGARQLDEEVPTYAGEATFSIDVDLDETGATSIESETGAGNVFTGSALVFAMAMGVAVLI